jgi:hypothetical protein
MIHQKPMSEILSISASANAEAKASAAQTANSFLPDVLLFLYLTCIAREYLWILNGGWTRNVIAWSISSAIGIAIVYFLTEKQVDRNNAAWRPDWIWLAIVVLPLLAFFFLRAPFPSLEFDNLNYHYVNAERALRGWPIRAGDLFPGTLLPNPAPDMVFGVTRYLLGYRLAPLLNVACLLWTGALVDQFLRTFVRARFFRYLAVLVILTTEPIAALVNTPMIDLLVLPLLLSCLLLIIRLSEARNKDRTLIKISLFMGISLAFKLTSLFFILPLIALLIYQLRVVSREQKYFPARVSLALAAAGMMLPSALFFGYLYQLTGNPFFPFYNNIFHSPLVASANFKEKTMGPRSVLEALRWPFSSLINPSRLVFTGGDTWYAGRLQLGLIFAVGVLLVKKTPKAIRQISIALLCGTWIWAFSSGIIRYANLAEILAGILCVYMLTYAYQEATSFHARHYDRIKSQAAVALFTVLLALQFSVSLWYGLTYYYCSSETRICDGISQPQPFNLYTRPTLDQVGLRMTAPYDPRKVATYFQEAAFLFRDRNARDFLSTKDRDQFQEVKVWINTYDGTSAYMVIAAPDAPIISVSKFLDLFDYMTSPEMQRRTRAMIGNHHGEKMYTLVQIYHLEEARAAIARVPMGFHFGKVQSVSLPLFSSVDRTNLLLVEILVDEG